MNSRVMLDHATLVAVTNVLDHPKAASNLDYAAASLLVENIVLHDELLVPGLPHVQADALQQRFENVIQFEPLSSHQITPIEQSGIDWVKHYSSAADALKLAGFHFQGLYVGSHDHELALEFGVSRSQLRDLNRHADSDRAVAEQALRDLGKSMQGDSPLASEAEMNGLIERWLSKIAWHDLRSQLTPDHPFGTRLYELAMEMHGEPPTRISVPVASYLAQIYWTLFRTRIYDLASNHFGADYAPHPVRAIASAVSRTESCTSHRHALDVIASSIRKVHQEGIEYLNEQLGVAIAPLNFAPMFPYIVRKMTPSENLIQAALRVRELGPAKELRQTVRQPTSAVRTGDLVGARKCASQLKAIEQFMRSEANISPVQSSANISLFGLTILLL